MPVKLAANGTLKGCHSALVKMTTNASLAQTMQKNVNNNSFWVMLVKFNIENFIS